MTLFNRYKYLLAYIIPILGFCSVHWSEQWSWLTFCFSFGLVPFLDFLLPLNKSSAPPAMKNELQQDVTFDWMLYMNIPLYLVVLVYSFIKIEYIKFLSFEYVGLVFSIGILVGAIGINVAHELSHRNSIREKVMAKFLLMTALYMHFYIEHNRGHHKNVATPQDPATARKGELVYTFYFRSMLGGYWHAWILENTRLKGQKTGQFLLKNEMLHFTILQLSYLLLVFVVFGKAALIFAIMIALFGILLLESINYVEHYGLSRKLLEKGRYEPQNFRHSWNSNHEVGRILLYELVRHSDHHYKTSHKYQILHHYDESPQLPVGYPGSIIIALIPPLWFNMMHKRIENIT